MIYLDNAATTKISESVFNGILPYLTDYYGNAGSMHSLGIESKKAIDLARDRVAKFLGCDADKIIFTSGGSEANNMVFYGVAYFLSNRGKNHIIVSSEEHDSVLNSVISLCETGNFHCSFISSNKKTGIITPSDIEPFITEKTGLVSIMGMNNETGAINDIKGISDFLKSKNIMFHTDCVQAAASLDININEIDCDFLSISGHKIHAPKGIGALYIKDKENILPIIYGGSSQEFGLRGGTENVANIVGLGIACENKRNNTNEDETISKLSDDFIVTLKDCLQKNGILNVLKINNENFIKSNRILSIRFDGVDAQTLVLLTSANGVCISSGSACNSREITPSHVLTDLGLTFKQSRETIRVSFSEENTSKDVKHAACIIAECVNYLLNLQ